MTVVVGMTDLLLLAPLDPDQKECLESVRQASDGLLLLLDEMVDFSRLEAGSLKLTAAEFSLSEVVEQARALLSRSAGTKVPFSVSIGGDVPGQLMGDSGRLAQMIAGLVRSAGKLRAAKPLVLKVAFRTAKERSRADGNAASGDDGVGLHFALGDAQAEFQVEGLSDEPGEWVTLESFRQAGYRGAGLSLPVTAALAAQMGGRLWMASAPAHPVVFRWSCRVGLPSAAVRPDLLSAIEQPFDRAPTASWHVLLAEDTRANQQFFRTVLEQRGHSVVAVANGREAVEAFASHSLLRPFDVVLLDLEMPVMDGRQAALALRESHVFKTRPAAVVALTAHRADANAQATVADGFDAVITKPCDLEDFFRVIDSAIRHASPQAAHAPADPQGEAVVDYQTALARLGGNEQLFRDLATFFQDDAAGILSELAQAIDGGDAARVERSAHSLRGLAANFGAPAAVQAAVDLQASASRGDLSQAQSLYELLAREIDKLLAELSPFVERKAIRRTPGGA